MVFFCLLILFLNLPLLLSGEYISGASDSIYSGKSLSGNQTIVSRGGKFELGFFTPGNSHNYYIGIWYREIPVQTVIWVANREPPIASAESSELKISQDGNLVLLDPSKTQIWSTNITFPKSNSTVAVLLNTGNLVLKENLESPDPIWQSFDHPTDTWVPGLFVGINKITGEYQILTSWKNSEDPAPGMFSHRLGPSASGDYLTLWNQSQVYDHLGAWNGDSFALMPQTTISPEFKIRFVETKERRYMACTMSNDSLLLRLVMDVSGQIRAWKWLDGDQQWMLIFSRPAAQCDVYSICGDFGVCSQMGLPTCGCLDGFEPRYLRDWNLKDTTGGCVRRSPLQCMDSTSPVKGPADVFFRMSHVKFPTGSPSLSVAGAEDCKLACSNHCSCSAYAYDGACRIWNGELQNLQQLSDADGNGGTLYVRLSASERPHSSTAKSKISIVAILGSILGILIISFVALWAITCRFRRRLWPGTAEGAGGSLLRFKYSELKQITMKFSVSVGRGGFGSVFAGVLPDSTPVAVKRLTGLGQGEKQFRAEVRTLGVVQHGNLVRLRGFCAEGDNRLLVYDYMSKGSLDSHLFKSEPPFLDWGTRYKIALGTARGLAYLHEECRERIIHCDIKPENILLDESYQPKVGDFGLAKLITRDFSRAMTTVRGTI